MKTSAHTSHECFYFQGQPNVFSTFLQVMHRKMFLQDYPVSEQRTTGSRCFYSFLAAVKLGLSNSGSVIMEWVSVTY